MIYLKNISGAVKILHIHEFQIDEIIDITDVKAQWVNDDVITAIEQKDFQVHDINGAIAGVANQLKVLIGNPVTLEENKDIDNRILVRPVAAKAGWTYQMRDIEFKTSQLDSVVNETCHLVDYADATLKCYDVDGVELTTQNDCDTDAVVTVLDFEPTHDYELIGGLIKLGEQTTENYRLWIVAVPDVSAENGGSKVMVSNIFFKYLSPTSGVEVDGRVCKYMAYNATYHTNKIRTIIRHPAGGKINVMITFEFFRP